MLLKNKIHLVITVLLAAVIPISLANGVALASSQLPVTRNSVDSLVEPSSVAPFEARETLGKLKKASIELGKKFNKGEPGLTSTLVGQVRSPITSGVVTTHLPSDASFDTESAETYISKREGSIILRLPIMGKNLSTLSVLGVMFNAERRVVSTTEVIISGLADRAVQLTVWNNGAPALNKTVSAEGQVHEADSTPAPNSAAAEYGFWSKLNDCLAGLGIGWAAITAITIACSAACVVTAGTGCAVCILAAAGITNANIAGCVAQASQGYRQTK